MARKRWPRICESAYINQNKLELLASIKILQGEITRLKRKLGREITLTKLESDAVQNLLEPLLKDLNHEGRPTPAAWRALAKIKEARQNYA